jgi:hypothetical protein
MARMAAKTIITALAISSWASFGASQSRKDVPPAPLPEAIARAKTAFLTNGGGSDLAYDEFYAQMKKWGRFQVAPSPSEAEVIIQLKYFVENGGTKVWSSTNTYTGQTQVHSRQITEPQLEIDIYDAKTKDLLGSVEDRPRLAVREKNREKEMINSADRLAFELQQRIEPPHPEVRTN